MQNEYKENEYKESIESAATIVLTPEQRRILTKELGFAEESVPTERKIMGLRRGDGRKLGVMTKPGPNALPGVMIS